MTEVVCSENACKILQKCQLFRFFIVVVVVVDCLKAKIHFYIGKNI